jgi:outer membrane protein assembly factor BamB
MKFNSALKKQVAMISRLFIVVFFFCVCQFDRQVIHGQNWPQFRGPQGNGVLETLEHPTSWGNGQNMAWTIEMTGGGLSSPIVLDDRIILTTAFGPKPPVSFSEGVRDMQPKRPDQAVKFAVICLNLNDGSKQWERTIIERRPEYTIHGSNSYATETPATDGKRIFVYFAAVGTVAALEADGAEIWTRNIGAWPTANGYGTASSLAVGEGKLFIQCDNDKSSFVVALDAATGDEVWRQNRTSRTSWSTPLLWNNTRRTELVTCGSGFVTSYDPNSGKELWTLSGVGMSFSASPASDIDRVYFGNSGPRNSGPLLAVHSGMVGQRRFESGAAAGGVDWSKMQAGPGMASPVSVGGYLYVPSRGILTCYSTQDGSVQFKERISLASMAASPWAAGDHLFLMDESGKTIAIKVGPEMNIVSTNQIDEDLFWSTPAVAGKSLLIRGVRKLYCIRQ